MNDHIKAGSTFYAKFVVSNSDDTINPGFEEVQGDENLQVVVDSTVSEIESHGGVAYVYECRAVRKVVRGKTRVIVVGKRQ